MYHRNVPTGGTFCGCVLIESSFLDPKQINIVNEHICVTTQVGSFFKLGTYLKMPVFCIKLDRVPGLSNEAKASVRRWLLQNKSSGAHNVPRRFGDSKNTKCTVISKEAFSEETKALLISGSYSSKFRLLC